ncbi:unnamed protein product [Bemisia tabaci]|uniref:Protein arginine methyltransferase NDUFAF7 n=1 Tax=Bemisia tabaci TaxID=7038 RepID=A0A9P0AE86_BEMTA|nr:unnamed protein product [Bemisia tabaci]
MNGKFIRSTHKFLVNVCSTNVERGMKHCLNFSTHSPKDELGEARNIVRRQSVFQDIKTKILIKGPLTVAEYMKSILTDPIGGYYMHSDVFGGKGDFTTSPEISQLFGEMIAVWLLSEWQKLGCPKPFQIVELGPGRGTMLDDILRVFRKFGANKDMSVRLVEVSPHLSQLQGKLLCQSVERCNTNTDIHYQKGLMKDSVPVFWYNSLQDVPHQFSLVVAHEFFDALPIHKFQKTENGWREILIDIDGSSEDKLRFIISRNETPACKMFITPAEKRDHFEVSPESGVIMDYLATFLRRKGGIVLVADYGHDGDGKDTFRAYKNHKQIHPLESPGSADLTADVDFAYLRSVVGEGRVISYGPVTQRDFLQRMGINIRCEILKKRSQNDSDKKALESGLKMLTDEDQMGVRFKFQSFFPAVLKDYFEKNPVSGFFSNQ